MPYFQILSFAIKVALKKRATRAALRELLDSNWKVVPEGSKLSKDDLRELIILLEQVDPAKEKEPLRRQIWQVLELLKTR
jgi:hypothetical protein